MDGTVDALQRGELRPGLEELAEVHVGHADAGAEGGADRLARDDGASARDLREGDVALGAGVVELHRGRGAARGHPLDALEVGLGEARLRFLRAQLGGLHRDVEGDEDGAGVHDLARLEADEVHRAGHLVAEGDRAGGEHGADRRRGLLMWAGGGDGRGDGLGRLRLIGRGGFGGADRAELPGAERNRGGEERADEDEGTEAGGRDGAGGSTHGGVSELVQW